MMPYQPEAIIEVAEVGKPQEAPSLMEIAIGCGCLDKENFKMYEGYVFATMKGGYEKSKRNSSYTLVRLYTLEPLHGNYTSLITVQNKDVRPPFPQSNSF